MAGSSPLGVAVIRAVAAVIVLVLLQFSEGISLPFTPATTSQICFF